MCQKVQEKMLGRGGGLKKEGVWWGFRKKTREVTNNKKGRFLYLGEEKGLGAPGRATRREKDVGGDQKRSTRQQGLK